MNGSAHKHRMTRIGLVASAAFAAAAGWAGQAKADTTVFSSGGFQLPETIISARAGFAPGAAYVVPDASIGFVGPGALFTVGASGGPPTQIANFGNSLFPIGGAFLPASYGALAGDLVVAGESGGGMGSLASVTGAGVVTNLVTSTAISQFTSAVVAPAGFGGVGGQLLIGDNGGGIDVLAAGGHSVSTFASISGVDTFGLAFAPAGFGAVGGDLLDTDGASGDLYAVNSAGVSSLFATVSVPAIASNAGLRQLAFAPAGFGPYGGDLFLSISGSSQGGGSLGEIVVLNSAGDQVAIFNQGSTAHPLDPRGLYFMDGDNLLASNGDPEIDDITPSSFVGVPEPSSAALLAVAGALLPGLLRRRGLRAEPAAA